MAKGKATKGGVKQPSQKKETAKSTSKKGGKATSTPKKNVESKAATTVALTEVNLENLPPDNGGNLLKDLILSSGKLRDVDKPVVEALFDTMPIRLHESLDYRMVLQERMEKTLIYLRRVYGVHLQAAIEQKSAYAAQFHLNWAGKESPYKSGKTVTKVDIETLLEADDGMRLNKSHVTAMTQLVDIFNDLSWKVNRDHERLIALTSNQRLEMRLTANE